MDKSLWGGTLLITPKRISFQKSFTLIEEFVDPYVEIKIGAQEQETQVRGSDP